MKWLDAKRALLQGTIDPYFSAMEKLKHSTFAHEDKPFAGTGRRINRFMLGADPEFIFENSDGIVHATNAGLRPALAFGADQNDRLVEMRPHPSRSAVCVVASLLTELRWMYRLVPMTRDLVWRSGAYAHRDGMGGHVHFGRKRGALRDAEVRGLDGLAKTLRRSGIFPNSEWDQRCAGDAHGQLYGRYSDTREQKHGYEYRTLPSWLDSPLLAYLVLTLSKLVVVDPLVTANWTESTKEHDAWERLRGLAKLYRGRDDDAWLLFSMMESKAQFTHVGGDFKGRWGIGGDITTPAVEVYPDCIAPTREDVEEIHNLLAHGKALSMREPEPNFRSTLPRGYDWPLALINPSRRPGVGDLMYDIVTGTTSVSFQFEGPANLLGITYPASWCDSTKSLRQFETPLGMELLVRQHSSPGFIVSVGREWRKQPHLGLARQMLTYGALPIWRVDEVESDSTKKWKSTFTRTKKEEPSEDRFNLQALLA